MQSSELPSEHDSSGKDSESNEIVAELVSAEARLKLEVI